MRLIFDLTTNGPVVYLTRRVYTVLRVLYSGIKVEI